MPASPGVYRVAAVLEAFAASPAPQLTFTEVLKMTGLNRATCHSVLLSLVETELLCRDAEKKFMLGQAFTRLGAAAVAARSPE